MIRKIKDLKTPCMSAAHNPSDGIVLEPGVYEYICPDCGEKTELVIGASYTKNWMSKINKD